MNIHPDILEKCQARNEKACYELYKQIYSYLMSICWRYSRNREEAVSFLNLAFSRIIFKLHHFSDKTPFKAWARRITINVIIDQLRKEKTYNHHIKQWDQTNGSHVSIVHNQAIQKMDYESLIDVLAQLPEATRDVFNLFVIDGYSHREISQMLSISEGTSKWHVSNARKQLQSMLGSMDDPNIDEHVLYVKSNET